MHKHNKGKDKKASRDYNYYYSLLTFYISQKIVKDNLATH